MAQGGKCVEDRPAMPPGSGAEPGEFFSVNPALLGGGAGGARGAPRFMYGFVHLERSGYLDALQKWDLEKGP